MSRKDSDYREGVADGLWVAVAIIGAGVAIQLIKNTKGN